MNRVLQVSISLHVSNDMLHANLERLAFSSLFESATNVRWTVDFKYLGPWVQLASPSVLNYFFGLVSSFGWVRVMVKSCHHILPLIFACDIGIVSAEESILISDIRLLLSLLSRFLLFIVHIFTVLFLLKNFTISLS